MTAQRRGRRPASGRSVLRDLRRRLERGDWPPGVTVLGGDDAFHADAAQRALLEALVPADASEMALTVYGEGKVDIADVVAAARSTPMFAPCRVVLVRDVAVLQGDPEHLGGYAASPPPRSFLLVRADKLDLRRALHKALSRAGRWVRFEMPADGATGETAREVADMARERGLRIDREVCHLVAEACAGDLHRARNELDKLDAWLGPDERGVDVEAARKLLVGGAFLSGWEVANAVLVRDLSAAVAAVRRLVEAGEEPIRMLGGLAWRARAMIQARAMLDRGDPPERIVEAARAWAVRREFLEGLRRYPMQELLEFPSRIRRADRTLKSRSIDPAAVLESLVRDLIRGRAHA